LVGIDSFLVWNASRSFKYGYGQRFRTQSPFSLIFGKRCGKMTSTTMKAVSPDSKITWSATIFAQSTLF